MKKIVSLLLALMTALSLTACSEGGLSLKPSDPGSPGSDAPEESDPGASAAPDSGDADSRYGFLGDTLSTYWFDFSVDDAYLCAEYEGYTPEEGNQLLVVTMSLKNTVLFSIDMWRGDFQAQWGSEDDAYSWPIEAVADEQLPDDYSLGINESRTGTLVYEVPLGYRDFSIAFLEVFEDDSEGEVYFVDFTPVQK